jgi:hypothetical protein
MPARSGRPAPGSTQPPPLSIPGALRAPPRPAITAPIVPPMSIPPIPAIPAIPAIPMLPNRAETEPHERAETVDQGVDQPTGSRVPLEIGDSTSQTNVSNDMVSAEELAASVKAGGAAHDGRGRADLHGGIDIHGEIDTEGHERATAAELGLAENTTTGDPVAPLEGDRAPGSIGTDGKPAAMAAGARPARPAAAASASALPIAVALPAMTPPVRDRPMPKLPITTAPDSLPPPKDTRQQSGPSPACPQCESPMAWVEEHLRFYCKSCRMYF